MKFKDAYQEVINLEYDKMKYMYEFNNELILIYRPSKLSARFKNYDLKKNFQIWYRHGNREFRPNHLRVMIDLNLRVRSRPDLKRSLLTIFDNIYYGKTPEEEIASIKNEVFGHYLNPIEIITGLHQLFIIEQDYCYNKESKFDPPTLFYQGWIRQFIDSPKEIDNLCMSVANRQPPLTRYTCQENQKRLKTYKKDRLPLWYLEV